MHDLYVSYYKNAFFKGRIMKKIALFIFLIMIVYNKWITFQLNSQIPQRTYFIYSEIIFLAEIFPLHFGLKYAGDDLFSGLFPIFFIVSAEKTLNYLVDRQTSFNQANSYSKLCKTQAIHEIKTSFIEKNIHLILESRQKQFK